MFDQIGWSELAVIVVLALFVFGPERLPHLAAEAGKLIRSARTYLRGMTNDLKTELGPELGDLDLASLHPKTFVRNLLEDEHEDDLVDQLAGRPRGARPLAVGEQAPWDPDTT